MGLGAAGTAALAGSALTAGATMYSASQKGSGGSSSQESGPWSQQQPYLINGYKSAQDLSNQRLAQSPNGYTGSLYSPINQDQMQSAAQGNQFAVNSGALPYTTANTSAIQQAYAPSYMQNAQNMAISGAGSLDPRMAAVLQNYATGATSAGGVSSPLSSALQNAAISGAGAISNGQNNLQAAAQRALADPTGQTISSANQYANNPAINAQIAAAEQPVLQTLHESTVPGLNRAASMGGNLNSSRAGMAEAMANRDAASQIGNIEGTMRGNAYNNGLSLAAQQGEAGTNAAIAAGSGQANSGTSLGLGLGNQQLNQAALGTNTALTAANSGLTSQLGAQALGANTRLGANAQLGAGVNAGVNAGTAANTQAAGNFALGQAAGGVSQTDQNAQLANAYQMWQNQNGSYQQGVLNDYMQAVNTGNGSSAVTQHNLPSNMVGSGVGGALAGASLFSQGGPFSNLFNSGPASNSSYQYDPAQYGYNGDPNSAGAGDLQSMGLYNPLSY